MAKAFFILALVIQASLIYASETDENEQGAASRDILKEVPAMEEFKDFKANKQDLTDMFLMPIPNANFFPTSSAALMAAITDSNKTAEEQLEDIKQAADDICQILQHELANMLTYVMSCDKSKGDDKEENDDNKLRKKRDTPMDSSELVMRLLKHIKANNEYQNIAIEKMMTAQEIADKFGIEFNPDPEILSDLAISANDQAKEMTSILQDAIELKNSTKNKTHEEVSFVPVDCSEQSPLENNTYEYYSYSVHYPDHQEFFAQHPFAPHEYMPEQIHRDHHAANRAHHEHRHDTPMPSPPHHHTHPPPVTPKPNYYDSMITFAPEYPYCPIEPVTTTTTILLPIEEIYEPEPELIGEEYEETVSSKMIVTRDEDPGTATVNHVMTYTLSEKAHFKKPEIEQLPQQMQYTFFLM